MSRWRDIEGIGGVCFLPDGRVELVICEELAERFAAAERQGMSTDDFVAMLLEEAAREERPHFTITHHPRAGPPIEEDGWLFS